MFIITDYLFLTQIKQTVLNVHIYLSILNSDLFILLLHLIDKCPFSYHYLMNTQSWLVNHGILQWNMIASATKVYNWLLVHLTIFSNTDFKYAYLFVNLKNYFTFNSIFKQYSFKYVSYLFTFYIFL